MHIYLIYTYIYISVCVCVWLRVYVCLCRVWADRLYEYTKQPYLCRDGDTTTAPRRRMFLSTPNFSQASANTCFTIVGQFATVRASA